MYDLAARTIQRTYKIHRFILEQKYGVGCYIKNGKLCYFDDRENAAFKIQKLWKRYVVRHQFLNNCFFVFNIFFCF